MKRKGKILFFLGRKTEKKSQIFILLSSKINDATKNEQKLRKKNFPQN